MVKVVQLKLTPKLARLILRPDAIFCSPFSNTLRQEIHSLCQDTCIFVSDNPSNNSYEDSDACQAGLFDPRTLFQ